MSNGKSKSKGPDTKSASAPNKVEVARKLEAVTAPPAKQPPLFRPTDWLAFGVTSLLVFIGYYLTLAPDLTLEDSGELAVGSYYAGIPHPPGYPVWTIYTYFFSHLVPIANIAYRVAMASAFAGALACGFLALIVSRGSSMMMEGIAELKNIDKRQENIICLVSGYVAGMLIGFNGFMWSQAVIVEVYSITVLSLALVLLCLLRWIYAPDQYRYLYMAMVLFGIGATNHQILLLPAIGIEIAIAAGRPKLGRDMFLGNSLLYLLGLMLMSTGHLGMIRNNPGIFAFFNVVGIGSLAACVWLTLKTAKLGTEWLPVVIMAALWLLGAGFYLFMPLAGMSNPPMQWGYPRTVEGFFHALSRGQYEKPNPTDVLGDPLRFVKQLGILFNGIVDEFNWVYAAIILIPFLFFLRMQKRERAWMIGTFSIYFCLGVVLLYMLNLTPDRQSVEISRVQFTASHALIALFVGYGITLIAASLATNFARFRPLAILGGGVTVILSILSLASTAQSFFHDQETFSLSAFFKVVANAFAPGQYGLPILAGVLLLAMTLLFTVAVVLRREKGPLSLALALFALMPATAIMEHWFENEQRGHLFGFWFGHDMFTPPFVAPDGKFSYDPKLRAEMSKDPEKAKLIYPEMTRDAVLYGGTDPGRFCPTYMIFAESFIPPAKRRDPNFDRRDVYIITQNALADGTYLMYIRAHYNRSKQYQYDNPFFQELCRGNKERELNYYTNVLARLVSPLDKLFIGLGDRIERSRRVGNSFFKETDFTDIASLASRLQKKSPDDPLSAYLFENLSPKTRQLLSAKADSSSARSALAEDLNVLLERERLDQKRADLLRAELDSLYPENSKRDLARKTAIDAELAAIARRGPFYTPERFSQVKLPDTTVKFIAQDPQAHTRVRLNRLLLEAAYPGEIARSEGGLYPDREINIATPDDSARCFKDYMDDAQKRLNHDRLHPNEPPQIRGGENVTYDEASGRVQVSGQVAVMAINGLITKVMFDANPDHEFFVEESFPLDWMYPHLTPFGVIMKINRQPLPELTEDIVRRDHEFWSNYSERFIGSWIKYETPVKEICDFAERVYLRHDFNGFQGDRKFVRDDQAQKAFSKLRSSIGGVYMWRVNECGRKINEIQAKPPAERQALAGEVQRLNLEQQRMIKEADFTFRQAFAYCPYSPEAVFRYIQLLGSLGRLQDALHIAETCQKFDPENGQINNVVNSLRQAVGDRPGAGATQSQLEKIEATYRAHPEDFQNALNLASANAQMGQTNRALEILDALLNHPKADANLITTIAQAYASFGNLPKLETALEKLVKVSPDAAEPWYDLAALKAAFNKNAEALTYLTRAVEINTRQLAGKQADKTRDLRAEVLKDPRFTALAGTPEFQKIVGVAAK